jgi:hypothetical protein
MNTIPAIAIAAKITATGSLTMLEIEELVLS